jgi:hypothetical protein
VRQQALAWLGFSFGCFARTRRGWARDSAEGMQHDDKRETDGKDGTAE